MKLKTLSAAMGAAVVLSIAGHVQAATEVQWWHAMGGKLGEKVVEIADGFNASQSDYKVMPVYKGNYTETMTAAIAAFRAKQQPHIVQVFEVGTASMMAAKGAIYPVYELMADADEAFDPGDYLASVTGYYTDTDGNLLSMPFNSSTPVLYYNKTAFEKAGIAEAPKTWPELEAAAQKAQAAGYPCGFTTGWQSWVQIENFSAWHDQPIGTKANGFAGMDTEFIFNSPVHAKHIGQLAEWQKTKIFDYGGRRSDSAPKFYGQECVMYMNSSAAYAGVKGQREGLRVRRLRPALLGGHLRSAAEHHHRRCDAVGAAGTRCRGVQGSCEVLQLPVLRRGAGGLASVHRLSADYHRRLRAHQVTGLL